MEGCAPAYLRCRFFPVALLLCLSAVLSSCGEDDPTGTAQDQTTVSTTAHSGGKPLPNACPAEGCKVRIASVVREGRELKITFEANYAADIARNHHHVYWDTYTAKQVTSDAQTRFGATQGAWVATQDNPYTTGDAVSVGSRGTSTRICVTAGDRRHNVIDPAIFDCRDVSDLL